MTIAPNKEPELLPYACLGVACAGLLYVILSALMKGFGVRKVMRFFPADRHRPDHYLHRPDAVKLRDQQLQRQLADRRRRNHCGHRVQHLG